MAKKINMTGKRYGKLVVVKEHAWKDKKPDARWDCLCDCGNSVVYRGASLRGGRAKSCGCERLAKHRATYKAKAIENNKDRIGLRFGALTIIEFAGNVPGEGGALFKCKCDCGNVKTIKWTNLAYVERPITSCGCMKSVSHRHSRRNKAISEGRYYGVAPNGQGFRIVIGNGKGEHNHGYYKTAEEAARAYDAKAIELYGEDAITNFGVGDEEDFDE
ncbi:exonuclease [Sphingomonas phage Kharn]|uniref:Exonuclease n=1 Tax=Sphingomonas phage Kharn TaxID=2686312 RepID=A0A6M3T8C1_9CAUD|nr:exonuclease [Sphingomonas phage Kharn]QJD54528.1 exonuclease [Sphingomonas phage Kharn]